MEGYLPPGMSHWLFPAERSHVPLCRGQALLLHLQLERDLEQLLRAGVELALQGLHLLLDIADLRGGKRPMQCVKIEPRTKTSFWLRT